MARYKRPDGTWYDDRYEGPTPLPRPASGAATDIVKPVTTDTARQARQDIAQPSNNVLSTGQAPTMPKGPTAAMQQGPGTTSSYTYRSTTRSGPGVSALSVDPFAPSRDTQRYYNQLRDMEAEKPGPFESRYESQIQTILDNILNRKSFDLGTDTNYQNLYNQYAQSYMAQGNRAMRDQLGAAAGLTGGYGSTAAQAAASQAYDQYMEGLNDRNMQLMNLAYQMYGDERADQYNQLNAFNTNDQIDYGRYRDDVGDYYRDLDYLANRYDTGYSRDYGQYTDARNYDRSVYEDDRDFAYNAEQTEYQRGYQRYQDAMNMAMQYAKAGLPIPAAIAKEITDYTGEADINNVIAAMPVTSGGSSGGSAGRSGGSGGSRRSSGKGSGETLAAAEPEEYYTTLSDVIRVMNMPNVNPQTVLDTFEEARRWYSGDEYMDQNRKGDTAAAIARINELEQQYIRRYSNQIKGQTGHKGAR